MMAPASATFILLFLLLLLLRWRLQRHTSALHEYNTETHITCIGEEIIRDSDDDARYFSDTYISCTKLIVRYTISIFIEKIDRIPLHRLFRRIKKRKCIDYSHEREIRSWSMRYFGIVLVVSRCRRVWRTLFANLGDSVPYSIASCKPVSPREHHHDWTLILYRGESHLEEFFRLTSDKFLDWFSVWIISHRENARISSISMRDWR